MPKVQSKIATFLQKVFSLSQIVIEAKTYLSLIIIGNRRLVTTIEPSRSDGNNGETDFLATTTTTMSKYFFPSISFFFRSLTLLPLSHSIPPQSLSLSFCLSLSLTLLPLSLSLSHSTPSLSFSFSSSICLSLYSSSLYLFLHCLSF